MLTDFLSSQSLLQYGLALVLLVFYVILSAYASQSSALAFVAVLGALCLQSRLADLLQRSGWVVLSASAVIVWEAAVQMLSRRAADSRIEAARALRAAAAPNRAAAAAVAAAAAAATSEDPATTASASGESAASTAAAVAAAGQDDAMPHLDAGLVTTWMVAGLDLRPVVCYRLFPLASFFLSLECGCLMACQQHFLSVVIGM